MKKLKIVALVLFCLCACLPVADLTKVNAASDYFSHGSGTLEDPYLITNAKELFNVRYELESHFRQTADIDANEFPLKAPIGTRAFRFKGSYDGGNHTISNINLVETDKYSSSEKGLFAALSESAVVKNVKIVSSSVSAAHLAGGIAGINNGLIENCYVDAEIVGVDGMKDSGKPIGGIAGLNGGTIRGCLFNGTLQSGTAFAIGGIAGWNNSKIDACYAKGQLQTFGEAFIGGIAGYNDGNNCNGVIENCRFIGDITGTYAGQLCAFNTLGKLTDCGAVTSQMTYLPSRLINCYVLTAEDIAETEALFGGVL